MINGFKKKTAPWVTMLTSLLEDATPALVPLNAVDTTSFRKASHLNYRENKTQDLTFGPRLIANYLGNNKKSDDSRISNN